MSSETVDISKYITAQISSTAPLEIRASSIPGARDGLFTTSAINEGEEIFRSDPLVNCVDDPVRKSVCDYCFHSSESPIMQSGRFREASDVVAPFKMCAKCKVCYYCSRAKAWKRYHRHECSILRARDLYARTRALVRLLSMRTANLISDEQWSAVHRLETHQAEHMSGPSSEMNQQVALFASMSTKFDPVEVLKIHCAILTNTMSMKAAEGPETRGTTLDLAGSLMNRSCDPNAFVFFEGRQMRVRALRPLRAGDEILQTYVDHTSSVFFRLATTESDYFFQCSCTRCQSEVAELKALTPENDPTWLEKLAIAQQMLLNVSNDAAAQFNSTGIPPRVADLESSIQKIARVPFNETAIWPDGMPPMPGVLCNVASTCKVTGNYPDALRYSLMALLTLRWRTGDEWVHLLLETVQYLSLLLSGATPHPVFRDGTVLAQDDAWNVMHGYLGELKRAATIVYGSDCAYTRAISKWYAEAVAAAGLPRPGSSAFRAAYGRSQGRLRRWAGVQETRGITLSV
ncbi:hypothetical protein BJY00DRAFT_312345 [Aspergillus carlsbadensis]|nr:hypothetical protein BJY00DRAFT_312345 [Aspergillus carlsbadensis]